MIGKSVKILPIVLEISCLDGANPGIDRVGYIFLVKNDAEFIAWV